MPGEIFYWLLNMSIASVICALPILLLRRIKRIPRRAVCLLWLIPLVRMCVPFGLASKYSIMALFTKLSSRAVPLPPFSGDLTFTAMNHITAAEEYFPLTYKISVFEKLFSTAGTVWLVVALAAVLTVLIVYTVTLREIKDAEPLGEGMYLSDKIRVPAVYGIVRPRIILPRVYDEKELHFILLHERAHIKRGDNLYRMLALLIVCVHWFNPLAWLFLKLLGSDIELACDEAVLSKCGDAEKKDYARTVLSAVEETNVFAAAFGGAKVRMRIENILSYKKLSLLSFIGFTVLILSIAYVLLTNAA